MYPPICLDRNRYSLRVTDCEYVPFLNGAASLDYALHRHHETGCRHLIGVYGHVVLDCRHNRKLLRSLCDTGPGIYAMTRRDR
jgi:hypothetical protein